MTETYASSTTYQTHCGLDGFSPRAPDCELHTAPEPGSVFLVFLGIVVWRVLRAIAAGRWDQRGADRLSTDSSGADQPGAVG